MPRTRARCSDCQQFHRDCCQLGLPECTGPDSIAADECCCFLPDSGIPSFDYRSIHALTKAVARFKKRQNHRAKLIRKCHRAYKRLIRERTKEAQRIERLHRREQREKTKLERERIKLERERIKLEQKLERERIKLQKQKDKLEKQARAGQQLVLL